MFNGEVMQVPGFCFTRLTDFDCFFWVETDDSYLWPDAEDIPNLENYLNYLDYYGSNYTYSSNMTDYEGGYYSYDGDDYILEEESVDVEKQIGLILYKYLSPFLLVLGIVGNSISAIIMKKLSRDVISTCLYLTVLAILDLFTLIIRCGNEWLVNITRVDLSNIFMVYSNSICKVYPFVFNFFFHLGKWLLVTVAIEGYIHVKYPAYSMKMCTLERARAVILLLTVILLCINSHFFWTFELVFLKESGFANREMRRCTFANHGIQNSETFQEIVWPLTDTLVADVVPDIICVVCFIVMTYRIKTGLHRGSTDFQHWQTRYILNPHAINQLKVTFLTLCALSFLLTAPKFFYVIISYLSLKYALSTINYYNDSQLFLVRAICNVLLYIFLSTKLFVYLATSQKFRCEFTQLFQNCKKFCCDHRKQKYQLATINNPNQGIIECESSVLKPNGLQGAKAKTQRQTKEPNFSIV